MTQPGQEKNFGMHACKEFMGVGGDLECMCAQGIHDTLVRLFPLHGLENLFDTAGPRKNFGMHVCKEFRIPLVRSFPIPWGLGGIERD